MARITSRSFFLGVLGVALLLGACSADSPTEPQPTPAPPSAPPLGVTVSITADPPDQAVGSTTPSTITVRATRQDGALFNGSLTITTDLGSFGSVGGPSTTTVTLVNGVGQAFFFPGNTAGVATLRVLASSTSTSILATTRITIGQVVFFLSSVSPGSGSAAGGEVVNINGGGFDGPVRVTFNGVPAEVLSVSSGSISVRTPPFAGDPGATGAPVTVAVIINLNEANQAQDALPSGFIYTSGGGGTRFLIASVTPTTGPNEGGTRVTITGDGFESPVQVTFGNNDVNLEAAVESVTRTQIIVRTPAASGFGQPLQNSSVRIRVKNLNSGLFAELGNAFRYGSKVIITSMTNGSGPVTGGTHVTLFGQGFDEPVAVSLAGVGQFVTSVTGTEIVFVTSPIVVTTCPASGVVPATGVRVVNIETGDGADAALTFNYIVPVLRLFGVSPTSGSVGGNVTITGQGIGPAISVRFGGPSGATAQIVSGPTPTSVTVKVPTPPPTFSFATEACDGNGDGIPGGTRKVPTPVDIVVKNLDAAGCNDTLTNSFTLNPPDTTCSGDTSTPPPPPVVQCNDGFDNDGDTLIDAADPQCTGPTDNSESS